MLEGSNSPSHTSADNVVSTVELVHETVLHWLQTEGAVDIDSIEQDASLFELGIDSLGAMTIGDTLERATGKRLNPEVLYELETITELAEYLDSLPVQPVETKRPQPVRPVARPPVGQVESAQLRDPVEYYERLNRRVRMLKREGLYFFESEIDKHDGAWVVVDGRRMLMLSSYEYLGLLGHPRLHEAATVALDRFGTGHHGARLLVGTTTVHKQLEAKIAHFMNAQDAIVFSSGYVANLATVSALVGPGDCVIGDKLNHASIIDGCRMSGAEFWEFQHNDMQSLAEHLDKANGRRTLVIVDAVFSMEGDIVNLPAVVDLCEKYGALLMVDEAHSLGVLGKTGRGVQEYFDLDPHVIDVKMGTLSKTLASSGGFVAGREEIVTYLRHHARGYIFSGALPATQVSTALAAIEVVEQEPKLVDRLWRNVDHYLTGLKKIGFDTGMCETPIVPIMTGNDADTLEITQRCRAEGLLVIPVCYPAVPMDAPRLRTCVSAIHSPQDIDFALDVLHRTGREMGMVE